MADLYEYGVAVHLYKPLIKRGVVDFAVGADWTPAAGDVKISKDGGAAANVTNLPSAITMGNTAMWDFSLTAAEMQAAKIRISVADSATKAVEDQFFELDTYGNASAQHKVNLNDSVRAGLTALPNAAAGGAAGLPLGDANARVDIGKWIGVAPAALSASGYLQVMLLRWLTDNAAGTPNALNNALVQADVERWGNAVVNALIAGRVDANAGVVGDKTGYGLSAAAVQAVWDALTANLTTANSIGKRLADDIDATISSRSTLAAGAAMTLTAGERNSVADALLDRADAIETGWTLRMALRLIAASAAAKLSGAATTTIAIRNLTDTKDRITATVDANGNRTAVVLDGA